MINNRIETPELRILLTTSHFILLEARQEPVGRMLDPGEHNHCQIIDIHSDVPFEPDCADMLAHNLRSGSEECSPSCWTSVQAKQKCYQVNYRRFAICRKRKGLEEGCNQGCGQWW